MDYQTLCLCYLHWTLALADNSDLGIDNSWQHAQPQPIIAYHSQTYAKFLITKWLGVNLLESRHP